MMAQPGEVARLELAINLKIQQPVACVSAVIFPGR